MVRLGNVMFGIKLCSLTIIIFQDQREDQTRDIKENLCCIIYVISLQFLTHLVDGREGEKVLLNLYYCLVQVGDRLLVCSECHECCCSEEETVVEGRLNSLMVAR